VSVKLIFICFFLWVERPKPINGLFFVFCFGLIFVFVFCFFGNIVNRKPPRGRGFLSINMINGTPPPPGGVSYLLYSLVKKRV